MGEINERFAWTILKIIVHSEAPRVNHCTYIISRLSFLPCVSGYDCCLETYNLCIPCIIDTNMSNMCINNNNTSHYSAQLSDMSQTRQNLNG